MGIAAVATGGASPTPSNGEGAIGAAMMVYKITVYDTGRFNVPLDGYVSISVTDAIGEPNWNHDRKELQYPTAPSSSGYEIPATGQTLNLFYGSPDTGTAPQWHRTVPAVVSYAYCFSHSDPDFLDEVSGVRMIGRPGGRFAPVPEALKDG